MKRNQFKVNISLNLSLSVLIFLMTSTISDGANIHFLYYINSFNFFVCKVLLGILVPFLIFSLLDQFTVKAKWVFVFLSISGISFYFSKSVLYASLIALVVTSVWFFAKRALTESAFLVLFAGILMLLYYQHNLFGSFSFITSKFSSNAEQLNNTNSESEIIPNNKLINLPFNVYILVFDELSRDNLYEGSQVSKSFPNFRKLSKNSISPSLSTTNFDSTAPSILTLLRGKLAKTGRNKDSKTTNYLDENLFDFIPESNLHIWGWVEPYCRTLEAKGKDSYCIDEHRQLSNKSFAKIFWMDTVRSTHIYFLNYPLALIKNIHNLFAEFNLISKDHGINSYLNSLIARSNSSMWKDQIPRDLERLEDFIPKIGANRNSLYYFHSALPHYAYFGDKDLNIREDESNIAFWMAETEDEFHKVQEAYEKTIQAADTVLGKILQAIEKKDPDALIIATSDHGAAQDFDSPLKRPTGKLLQSVVEIPLFIKLPPKHPLQYSKTSKYQHLDFLPTLYDILELEKSPDWEGFSIFNENTSQFHHESNDSVFKTYFRD